jgi:F0F1-type ATP synthase membrane subunit a
MISFLAEDPLEHVVPHPIFGNHLTWFTNQGLMALLAGVIMLLVFPRLFRRPDGSAPTGARNFFESILEYLRIEVFRPALKENTDRFTPFLWTVFFFILICNLLGCVPISDFVSLITWGHIQHIGGTATGALSTTATLAVCAFIMIHFHGLNAVAQSLMDGTYGEHEHHTEHTSNGGPQHEAAHDLEHMRAEALPADVNADLRALGDPVAHYNDDRYVGPHEKAAMEHYDRERAKMSPGKAILLAVPLYLWNFAPHPFRPGPGESNTKWLIDVPFFLFLLVLELLGALIKPFALAMRLFANMVAGHVVLAVLIMLALSVPGLLVKLLVGTPIIAMYVAIYLLEIFVALLQAYIFMFLTTLFIASAVAPEH